ncbi:MAG: restriction endonuclease subunit S [Saprospiraceae bacterium]|nr:restriction endonuclease subunit S [Saprospiraceae bacterium]
MTLRFAFGNDKGDECDLNKAKYELMSWETVKLKEVCRLEKGNTGIMKAIPGDYPIVTMAAERKTHNEYQFDAKAIIIPMVSGSGHGKASINRIHYQEGKFAVGTILCAVIPKDHDV